MKNFFKFISLLMVLQLGVLSAYQSVLSFQVNEIVEDILDVDEEDDVEDSQDDCRLVHNFGLINSSVRLTEGFRFCRSADYTQHYLEISSPPPEYRF